MNEEKKKPKALFIDNIFQDLFKIHNCKCETEPKEKSKVHISLQPSAVLSLVYSLTSQT